MPNCIEVNGNKSENLFEIAREENINIDNACSGRGNCGFCKVKIIKGEEYLNKPTPTEKIFLGNVYFITKIRLSCQCEIITDEGDIEVLIEDK